MAASHGGQDYPEPAWKKPSLKYFLYFVCFSRIESCVYNGDGDGERLLDIKMGCRYTGLLFSTLRSLTSQAVNQKMRLWTLALASPYPCLQGTTSCSLTIFHFCSQMKYYLVRSPLGKINRLMRIWVTDSCLRSFFGSTHHMARHVFTKVLPDIADLTPRIWHFFKKNVKNVKKYYLFWIFSSFC